MIKFSARDRAFRQLSALRRLAQSENPAEAKSAKLKADRLQRRFHITEQQLQLSNSDMSFSTTSEGWDSPWRLALLGGSGTEVAIHVDYDVPNPLTDTPGLARLRGHCSGRMLREAAKIRDHIEKRLSDPDIQQELNSMQMIETTTLGSLNIQKIVPMRDVLGDDFVEVYAIGLVVMGISKISKKLRAEIEKNVKIDSSIPKPPKPPEPDSAPTPAPPPPAVAPALEPKPEPSPFKIRYDKLTATAAQLLQVPGFVLSASIGANGKAWENCANTLSGEEPEEPLVEIKGLLTDSRHGNTDFNDILALCAELNRITKHAWIVPKRDTTSVESANGYWRVSVEFPEGKCTVSGLGYGVTTLMHPYTGPGWQPRLASDVRDILRSAS